MDIYKARTDFYYWLSYQVTNVKLLDREELESFRSKWYDKVNNNFEM